MGFLRGLIDAITGRGRKPIVEKPEVKPPVEKAKPEVKAPVAEVKPVAAAPVERVEVKAEAEAPVEQVEEVKPEAPAERAEEAKPEAEAARDDFTAIRGIGSATETKLNEAGITTYAQLAELTPERLEEITSRSAARIAADGWIPQAKKLAEKKA